MKLLTSLIALTLSSTTLCAKPWRGITPLHSSRSDVERILGKPSRTSHHWSTYQTDSEAVSILYSNGLPCRSGANSEWRVPGGKVVSITVAPKTIVLFSALNLDMSKFQKLTDSHMLDRVEYLNKDEGESISIVNGEVSSFTYMAGSADGHLRCPNTEASQEKITEPTYMLDIYSNLKLKDEEIRLDNFAIQLMERPEAKGYIFVYSGSDLPPPKARLRAKHTKNYLVRVRNVKSERLVVFYGGERAQFTAELFIVPKGAKVPSPAARP